MALAMTYNAKGNIVNGVSLAASAKNGYPGDTNTWALDFSAKYGAWVLIEYGSGSAVAATAGLKVEIFAGADATPDYETIQDTAVPTYTFQFPQPTTSKTYRKAIFVDPGKYAIRCTNLDATNAIAASSLYVTTATIDTI